MVVVKRVWRIRGEGGEVPLKTESLQVSAMRLSVCNPSRKSRKPPRFESETCHHQRKRPLTSTYAGRRPFLVSGPVRRKPAVYGHFFVVELWLRGG